MTSAGGRPDAPEQARELKSDVLRQVDDAEREWGEAQRENFEIMARLSDRGVNFQVLGRIARDNHVDAANAFQYNAFLKAVEQQI